MTFPAADTDRLTAALAPVTAGDVVDADTDYSAALAYIATAEGTAAAMAERACDRCGLDFAACPTEILDAAERRAAELAPVVAPEVQAVLDARAAVVVAEAAESALSTGLRMDWDHDQLVARAKIRNEAGRARGNLARAEAVVYVPDTTPAGSLRAVKARIQAIRDEMGPVEAKHRTAGLKGAHAAKARHADTLAAFNAALAPLLAIRDELEAVVYPD